MPTDYFLNQSGIGNPNLVNQEVRDRFEATDLAVYSSFATDTAVYTYSSISDGPSPPNWVTSISNRYLEIWWAPETIQGPDIFLGKTLEVRDTEKRSFITDYYVMLDMCKLTVEGQQVGVYLVNSTVATYGQGQNMTVTAKGSYLSASVIFRANGTDTVYEGWAAGTLQYDISFEISFDAMKPSAWMLIGQLVTFQAPDFGIPGLFGDILSYALGLGFWIAIALIAYTIITKLIPTIQGGIEN